MEPSGLAASANVEERAVCIQTGGLHWVNGAEAG